MSALSFPLQRFGAWPIAQKNLHPAGSALGMRFYRRSPTLGSPNTGLIENAALHQAVGRRPVSAAGTARRFEKPARAKDRGERFGRLRPEFHNLTGVERGAWVRLS